MQHSGYRPCLEMADAGQGMKVIKQVFVPPANMQVDEILNNNTSLVNRPLRAEPKNVTSPRRPSIQNRTSRGRGIHAKDTSAHTT